MRFLARLFASSPDDETPAAPTPTPANRPEIAPPAPDTEDELIELSEDDPKQILEEIYITIDYEDANRRKSRRRITLLSVALGRKGPMLTAYCHERKALRTFRTDRIDCFIDQDGEVFETDWFFKDLLGIKLPVAEADTRMRTNSRAVSNKPPSQLFRERMFPSLSLLVAISKCDRMHDTEVSAILDYLEDEAFCESWAGAFNGITVSEIDAMEPVIRKMRPRRGSLTKHLDDVSMLGDVQLRRFNKAVRKVIHADGHVSEEEIELYSLIEEWRDHRTEWATA